MVYFGDANEIQDQLDKYDIDFTGYSAYCIEPLQNVCHIYFDIDEIDSNVIVHESVHAGMSILNYKGIKFDYYNQEMLAYLVGYIAGEIMGE